MSILRENKSFFFVILPLIILSSTILWYCRKHLHEVYFEYQEVQSSEGVWDLRNVEIDGVHMELWGEVEYIPDVLLTPEEFEMRSDEILIGRPNAVTNVSTSRTRILVPEDRIYMITGMSIDYSDRIYINGIWRQDVGLPGTDRDSTQHAVEAVWFEMRPVEGVIEIVQQTSNFAHRDSGGHVGYSFGTADTIKYVVALLKIMNGTVGGIFLTMFIICLFMTLAVPAYRASIWFACFSFVMFVRNGLTDAKIFVSLFPNMPWHVAFRMEYMATPLLTLFCVLVVREMFPGLLHKLFLKAIAVLSAGFIVFFIFADTYIMSYSMLVYYGVFILAILYIVARMLITVRKLNLEQTIMLIGLVFFFLAAIHDVFYTNHIYLLGFGQPILYIAMIAFTFFQLVAVFYGIMSQIKKAQEKEQELALENKALYRMDQLKTQFFANMSHELKTPLTIMSVYAQLTEKKLPVSLQDSETIDYLETITSESDRMSRLVSQLIGMTRMQEDNEETQDSIVELSSVAKQVISLYTPICEKKNNLLALTASQGEYHVRIGMDQIVQVLLNLLDNANKATRNGAINISVSRESNTILLCVTDNGCGMEEEAREKAFGRYFINEENGTGLGLGICVDIIEAAGGRITLDSVKGQGTNVKILLPVCITGLRN